MPKEALETYVVRRSLRKRFVGVFFCSNWSILSHADKEKKFSMKEPPCCIRANVQCSGLDPVSFFTQSHQMSLPYYSSSSTWLLSMQVPWPPAKPFGYPEGAHLLQATPPPSGWIQPSVSYRSFRGHMVKSPSWACLVILVVATWCSPNILRERENHSFHPIV